MSDGAPRVEWIDDGARLVWRASPGVLDVVHAGGFELAVLGVTALVVVPFVASLIRSSPTAAPLVGPFADAARLAIGLVGAARVAHLARPRTWTVTVRRGVVHSPWARVALAEVASLEDRDDGLAFRTEDLEVETVLLPGSEAADAFRAVVRRQWELARAGVDAGERARAALDGVRRRADDAE